MYIYNVLSAGVVVVRDAVMYYPAPYCIDQITYCKYSSDSSMSGF